MLIIGHTVFSVVSKLVSPDLLFPYRVAVTEPLETHTEKGSSSRLSKWSNFSIKVVERFCYVDGEVGVS